MGNLDKMIGGGMTFELLCPFLSAMYQRHPIAVLPVGDEAVCHHFHFPVL